MVTPERKVVLITGAASGFGLLTSLRFAEKGYKVISTMRDVRQKDQLMQKAREMQIDHHINCWKLDVTNKEDVRSIVSKLKKEYGRIDILINNAGFAIGGMVEEVPLSAWREQFETNFFAVVQLTQALLPLFRKQQSGMIFNISSISGRIGLPGFGPYSASKHALEGFTESLRLELQPFGIHVILIEPGAYKTAIWNKGFERVHQATASPYRSLFDAVLAVTSKTAEMAPDPDEVARKIVAISSYKKPKLRYILGRGTWIALIGKTLLPWNVFERILMKAFRRSMVGDNK